jgi:predicted O-methyltransferase YrrM
MQKLTNTHFIVIGVVLALVWVLLNARQTALNVAPTETAVYDWFCSRSAGLPSRGKALLAKKSGMYTGDWYDIARQELYDLVTLHTNEEAQYYTLEQRLTHVFEGSIKKDEAITIREMIDECAFTGMSMLEIGSFVGMSSRWALDVTSEWEGTLTSVDPNIRHRVFNTPGNLVALLNKCHGTRHNRIRGFWMNYTMEGVSWDYYNRRPFKTETEVKQIMKEIPIVTPKDLKKKFDLIFIDAYHTYEDVKFSFDGVKPLLNSRGCIIFHDVIPGWPGVMQFIDELQQTGEKDHHTIDVKSGMALFRKTN